MPETPTPAQLSWWLTHHLRHTVGTTPSRATTLDWRIALSHTIRDLATESWLDAQERTLSEGRKQVSYLSMEFLIGRLLEDLTINLGIRASVAEALESFGVSFASLIEDEPDAALGNGGLGRLAACYLESMSTLACPAIGYGLRFEHGLFRQGFEGGEQIESPEDWLAREYPWSFARPEIAYEIGLRGEVEHEDGRAVWRPRTRVAAAAYDTPIVGFGGEWANTLRLWAPVPDARSFDLSRFNAGDFAAASERETLALAISRVLYPDDTTDRGKELRLVQEYVLSSASVQDILHRHLAAGRDLSRLPTYVAIQMNDTHPSIAGPELIRLLVDHHGVGFDAAVALATEVLGYTNHTLLPEALEQWSVGLMRKVLPRHLEIIERLDAQVVELVGERTPDTALIADDHVKMGNLAFVTSHRVNGVSALHTDLVRQELFPRLDAHLPGRIVNITNGVTPRRWLALANPPLADLITEAIGAGWHTDLDRLRELEPFADDPGFRAAFGDTKRRAKERLDRLLLTEHGWEVPPDALYDVQAKRIHEYKRQLLNIYWTIAHWQRIRQSPNAGWVPRVKLFAGKAAPSYHAAKSIIRLINDVGAVINADPETRHLLRVVFPPNYNVTMAERMLPAADLSEQISTAGMEASGTGNMKLALNGALTIGTLDGANVEIREQVGAEHFFLFGLTAEEVAARRAVPDHARHAIEANPTLAGVLQAIADGVFSPGDPHRYGDLLHQTWHSDWFLVASDFHDYDLAQAEVDRRYRDSAGWQRSAILNIARMGAFSSDRAIREYMTSVWGMTGA